MQLTAILEAGEFSFLKYLHSFFKTKTFLVVKLSTIFIFLACLQVSASGNSQSISITGKNITLKKAFTEIQKQSGFTFLYFDKDLLNAKRITIHAQNEDMKEVLNKIFAGQPLTYSIINETIVVKEKEVVMQPVTTEEQVQQTIDVRGKIVNTRGEPVIASVAVKGTATGVTTNSKGEFEIKDIDENAVLVISGVGIETFEVKVKGQTQLNLTAKIKIVAVEEIMIVNTGYQTISKERSTGSYGVIEKEQLEKPSTNISQRLIGMVSGLQAKTLDVNGNPTFEIRGKTSLTANANPLIVVDGFPVQGDFNSINPNDVESVTVLKDAAAASVWGSRSANGVIVITTKKARIASPLKVGFNAFTSIGAKFDLNYVRPLASSAETVEYERLTYNYWKIIPDPNDVTTVGYNYGKASILMNEASLGFITPAQREAGLETLKKLDNRQQIKDYLLANPTSTQYNLSLSGGTERMSNNLSLMHEKNQSNFKETGNKRYIASFRNNSEITKWMGLDLNATYIYNKANNNGVTLANIQAMSPYDMLKNPDGSLTDVNQWYTPILQRYVPMSKFPYADWTYNPIQEIANRDFTTEQTQARLNAALNFKIIRGLTARVAGQYELANGYTRNIANENTFEVRRTVNTATTWNRAVTPNTFTLNLPKGSIMNQSRSRISSYNLRAQIDFSRVFADKHEVNIAAGTEIENIVNQAYTNPTTYGYNDATLGVGTFPNGPGGSFYTIRNYLGTAQTFAYVNSFAYATQRRYAANANAAYTYNGKYTLSGSYKVEASNFIADNPDIRYDPFYSIGAAWKVSKESFMRTVKWVDRLNARVTYGQLGNYDASTAVKPLITPSASSDIFINDFTAQFSSFGNPTLRWERTSELNLGIDFSLFRRKLFGKIEMYDKHGKDLLASIAIPAVYGTTTQRLNNAAMRNWGIEVELGTAMNITKDLTWSGNITASYNDNKITNLFVVTYNAAQMFFGGASAYVIGENANSLWRYRYAGVVNGVPSVYGLNGAKVDYYSGVASGNAVQFMKNAGTSVAPFGLNFMSSFQYKGLNLSFILTSYFGHVFQRTGFNYPSLFGGRVLPNVKLTEVLNADSSKIAPLPPQVANSPYYLWQTIGGAADYLIESANHMRLQEVNLTYTIPSRMTDKIHVNRLNVYVQGNDLLTIYANKAKEDPVYPLGTMNPRPRYTFGIRFDF